MPDHDEKLSLDAIGILEGTNKSSLLVDYLRHYERIFNPFRRSEFTLIEIGIDQGASLRMWSRFFPKATIVGVDNKPDKVRHAADRVIVEIGSQSSLGFLTDLCKKYHPTIVIDDGSHQARDVLFTFQTMFSFVEPGGVYVMEDLHLHFGNTAAAFAATATTLPSDYIFSVGTSLVSNAMSPGDDYGLKRYLFDQIDRIEVIRNSLIVTKKAAAAANQVEKWMDLTRRSGQPTNWHMLVGQLQKVNASPKLVAEALAHCIKLAPTNSQNYRDPSLALEAMGDIEGAITAAQKTAELAGSDQVKAVAQRRVEALRHKGGNAMAGA